jgi:predicted transposase/invertase (TIGR01784 family)
VIHIYTGGNICFAPSPGLAARYSLSLKGVPVKKIISFDKDADIFDIRFDAAFKAVFTRDTPQSRGALKGLLACLIRKDISILTLSANEPPPTSPADRQIRYDISCRFNDGELADIEMTLYPQALEVLRLEFYVTRMFAGQHIGGNRRGYKDLKRTYQISLVNRNLFLDDALVHEFEYYDVEHNLSLGGKTRIITVELAKVAGIAERKTVGQMDGAERWATFLCYCGEKGKRELVNGILKAEEAIAMAGETILEFTEKEREWFRNESKLKYELDRRTMIAEAQEEGHEEGLKEGRKEGIEIGEARGIAIGEERGIAIGIREEKLRTARNLKRMGLSDEQTASALGLSAEDLKNLG